MLTYINAQSPLSDGRFSFGVSQGRFVEPDLAGPVVDLDGKIVLPGFIDAHCHILPAGLDLLKLNLRECQTREEVLDLVQQWHNENPDGWLHAVQYDQTKFADGQHLTRYELDKISTTRPILLRHFNGHAGVANSAALRVAGVQDESPDPVGGEFGRDASGRVNGVLLENGLEAVDQHAPDPDLEEMVEAILRAGESMAGYGITCATDMMTGRFDLEKELQAYKIAANRGCAIRTRLCVQWSPLFGPRALDRGRFNELLADFNSVETKVIGAKIFCDGAIASATAAIYGKFEPVEAKGPIISKHAKAISTSADGREVSGQLIYSPERMNQMVQIAHDQGFAVAIHGIGDYAVDLVLNAFEATGEPSRHRVEHAMLMSDAQIMRLASLNVHCTFQPEFLYRFGHAYRRQLGDERASKLKRIRSTLDAGVSVSINSDRPIVVGDPWVGVSTAAIRPPAFDPAENITLREAILGYTKGGAVANGDEGEMGEIKVGQHADFMIVDGPCEPHKPIEFELHRGRPN